MLRLIHLFPTISTRRPRCGVHVSRRSRRPHRRSQQKPERALLLQLQIRNLPPFAPEGSRKRSHRARYSSVPRISREVLTLALPPPAQSLNSGHRPTDPAATAASQGAILCICPLPTRWRCCAPPRRRACPLLPRRRTTTCTFLPRTCPTATPCSSAARPFAKRTTETSSGTHQQRCRN